MTQSRQTPLYPSHIELGGRIVDFEGWAMPVLYTGILEESRAVRSSAGIFDISHMGRIRLHGKGAAAFLQNLTSNNVERLDISAAQYSLLMNRSGGIIDDIIIYRESTEAFLVVINAGNTYKDLDWIRLQASEVPDVTLTDMTAETAMIAVQGPKAADMMAILAGSSDVVSLKRFQYGQYCIAGIASTCCRTGYTGEDGFEVIVSADSASHLWKCLTSAGAIPCGLGARDALRIEAGYPLYGHEITDNTSPVEAGLMWAVDMQKGAFIGADEVQKMRTAGPARRLVGLTLEERIIPRQGYTIHVDEATVGIITSGVFSPSLGHSIAMAYIDAEFAHAGQIVLIAIRDKWVSATVVPKKSLLSK